MKISIDVCPLSLEQKTGVSYYIEFLVGALLAQGGADFELWAPDLERDPFALLSPPGGRKTFRGRRPFSRAALESLWPGFAIGAVGADVDVFHLPYLATLPPRRASRTKFVATIHDLAFARFPEVTSHPTVTAFLSRKVCEQAALCDHLIADSHATARDLQDLLGVSPERITVVHLGTDLQAPRAEEASQGRAALDALGVPENYLLCVGAWEPRKNLSLLLRAVRRLRPWLRRHDVKLCLAGAKGWRFEGVAALLDELRDVTAPIGYVPRSLLPVLYAHARLFVYPSLYEGFGLPVLEAMTCGCPVLCSDTSSLPEVAGDAALRLPPGDEDGWANALQTLLEDESLRAVLRERGFAQARKFSWQRAARETLDVYRSVVAGN